MWRLILILFLASCGDREVYTVGLSGKCGSDLNCATLCYTKFQCNANQDELDSCLQGDVYYAQEQVY